jgi:hypothetical protein
MSRECSTNVRAGLWFSGIMLVLGTRGPGFDSRQPPIVFASFSCSGGRRDMSGRFTYLNTLPLRFPLLQERLDPLFGCDVLRGETRRHGGTMALYVMTLFANEYACEMSPIALCL